MSEANFWKEIKKNVGHKGHWTRIESHATADGFPDAVFTVNNVDGVIELKYENSNGETPEIRSSQIRWFRRAARNGSNCWLFSKVDNLYILHKGYKVPFIHDKNLFIWIAEAKKVWIDNMDWVEFLALITKHNRQ